MVIPNFHTCCWIVEKASRLAGAGVGTLRSLSRSVSGMTLHFGPAGACAGDAGWLRAGRPAHLRRARRPQSGAARPAASHDRWMVADTIVAAGAFSAQVEMTASSDDAVSQPEVRVTVR